MASSMNVTKKVKQRAWCIGPSSESDRRINILLHLQNVLSMF